MKNLQRVMAGVAVLFGVVTLVAGGRVLLGGDPGYLVYRPLLIYNTAMGAAYVLAGALGWASARRGQSLAAAIFALNAAVLAWVWYLRAAHEQAVAAQSVAAMTFRTGAWLLLLVGFAWLARRQRRPVAGA